MEFPSPPAVLWYLVSNEVFNGSQRIRPRFAATSQNIPFFPPPRVSRNIKSKYFHKILVKYFHFEPWEPHQTCLEQPLLWCRQPYNSRITTELQRRKLKSTSLIASGGSSQIGSGLNLPNLGPFDRLLCTNGCVSSLMVIILHFQM